MTDKIFYEAQLSCPEGRWGMVLTISKGRHHWTSPWFALPNMRFQTFTEARTKAAAQIIALRGVLEMPEQSPIQIIGPAADAASVYTFGDERDHPEGSIPVDFQVPGDAKPAVWTFTRDIGTVREYWRAMHARLVREGRLPERKHAVVLPLEGAWKCSNGHWFAYEPPPAWPPWCAIEGCESPMLLWIVKDDVTGKDWPPYLPYQEGGHWGEPPLLRPLTDGPPWIWPGGQPPRPPKEGEEDGGELLPEVRQDPEEP